jgi:RNA polymerase II subunit A small phosphatase-like protein
MDRPLLILDIDETLVYATREPQGPNCDFRLEEYFVTKRPCLEEFLDRIFRRYLVAVWTSASSSYAAQMVTHIFPDPTRLQFVWDRSRCTIRRELESNDFYIIKDLKKVKRRGFKLERVLMIDDTPRKPCRNFGNHLALTVFEGDTADRELPSVLPYLNWLSGQENFRVIEKRRWRTWAPPS